MKTSNKSKPSKKQDSPQANAQAAAPKAKTIKLGIDVHLDRYVVVRLIEGGPPQPPQLASTGGTSSSAICSPVATRR